MLAIGDGCRPADAPSGPSSSTVAPAEPTGTGASETGASETGTSETGTSETGTSETGTSETGTSETGPASPDVEATPSSHSPPPHAVDAPVAQRSPNRLAQETSPYLRLHMHNPVDWYPWGDEAFDKARRENKLIFLSVGYSSCYWCHVMERESFTDDEIASFLNENFVCIKVDREERPDVDSIYMLAVQIVTGRGGWPMSVFLLPDGKPFFGGTYFPARDGDRAGATGFLTVVRRVQEFWTTRSDEARATADRLTEAIQAEVQGPAADDNTPLDAELPAKITAALAAAFDDQYGGFGFSSEDPQQPKFPEASNLLFLVDRLERTDDADCRRMLTTTLDHMAQGGIWDHLGGGFHRYSTDRFWRIPHFEKMLYDNAQLLTVYSRAFHATGDPSYRQIVDDIVAYLSREMRDEGGAYYAALDAESDHVEGKYYRWTQDEVTQLLGERFATFAAVYGLNDPPNFEEHFYVLQLSDSWTTIAERQQMTLDQLNEQLRPAREALLQARGTRERPLTDDKLLCSWNGQVIRGLADAGRLCDRPEYVRLAADAAEFVLSRLRADDGRLWRTYREGQATLNAYLDDYAFLVDGLIGLHLASGEERWLDEAQRLTQQQIELFWDETRGGFFFTSSDHESLIARSKQLGDGAQPAGNSVAATNLLYLATVRNLPEYRQFAERTIRLALEPMQRMPRLAPRMGMALSIALEATP